MAAQWWSPQELGIRPEDLVIIGELPGDGDDWELVLIDHTAPATRADLRFTEAGDIYIEFGTGADVQWDYMPYYFTVGFRVPDALAGLHIRTRLISHQIAGNDGEPLSGCDLEGGLLVFRGLGPWDTAADSPLINQYSCPTAAQYPYYIVGLENYWEPYEYPFETRAGQYLAVGINNRDWYITPNSSGDRYTVRIELGFLAVPPDVVVQEVTVRGASALPSLRGMSKLLPRKIRATEAWDDYATAIDFLISNNILDPAGKIVTLRDAVNIEVDLLPKLSELLGFSLRSDYYSTAQKRFIVRSLYEYYAVNGTPSFESFLSILARHQLKLNMLWTSGYEDFQRHPSGKSIYEGGSWYMTPHYEIYLEGEESYAIIESDMSGALGINLSGLGRLSLGSHTGEMILYQSMVDEDLIETMFYDFAPVHLVLERIVRGYTATSSMAIGADYRQSFHTGRSYDELAPGVGVLDVTIDKDDISGPLALQGYLSNIYTTPVPVRYRTVPGTLSAPASYQHVTGTVTVQPGQSQFTIEVQPFSATNPGDFYLQIDPPVANEYRVWRRRARILIEGEAVVVPDPDVIAITPAILAGYCQQDTIENAGYMVGIGLELLPTGVIRWRNNTGTLATGSWHGSAGIDSSQYEVRFSGSASGPGTSPSNVWLRLDTARFFYNQDILPDAYGAAWLSGRLEIRNRNTGAVLARHDMRGVDARSPDPGYCSTWPDVPPTPPRPVVDPLTLSIPLPTTHLPSLSNVGVNSVHAIEIADGTPPYQVTVQVVSNPTRGQIEVVSQTTTSVTLRITRLGYGAEGQSGTVRVTAQDSEGQTATANITVLSPAATAPPPPPPGGPGGPGGPWNPEVPEILPL